jgi:polysaccharide transporter, PST family
MINIQMINTLKKLNSNKDLKTVRNNFLSLSVLQILNMFLPLLILPFLVRNLGLENFGLLVFSQAFVAYFTLIIDYGFNISATREISTHKNDKNYISKVFYSVFFIKTFLLLVSIVIFSIVIFSFELFRENYLLHYLTFSMIVGQMLFPVWFFQGIENMKMIAILNVIIKAIYTIMIFVFISSSEDLLYVAGFNSASFIFVGIIAFFMALKNLNFISLDYDYIRSFFKESTTIFMSNFFSSMYSVSNSFLLGVFTNNTLVGIYGSFERIITSLKSLYFPLYQALFPYVSRQKNKKAIIKKLILPMGLFGFIMMIVFYSFSQFFINLLYSNEELIKNINYFEYMTIIPLLASVNMLFNFLYLNSMKMYKERMKIMITSGIISFIIAISLLSLNFEIYAVVISYISVEFLLLIFGIYYIKKG